MQEPLNKADLQQMPNTGMNDNVDQPYVSVHVNFDKLINQDKNISELVGTEFYVNCCTNCCATTVKFTDETGITKNGDEISIGVKKRMVLISITQMTFVICLLIQVKLQE